MSISGNKDVDREILNKVDDIELLNVCSIDKYTWNKVCDDNFLRRRLSKYSDIEKYKKENKRWKRFFLKVTNYIILLNRFNYKYTFGNFKKQYLLLSKYSYRKSLLLIKSAGVGELELVIWCLEKGARITPKLLRFMDNVSYTEEQIKVKKYLSDMNK
jgi:hypothetical protein